MAFLGEWAPVRSTRVKATAVSGFSRFTLLIAAVDGDN